MKGSEDKSGHILTYKAQLDLSRQVLWSSVSPLTPRHPPCSPTCQKASDEVRSQTELAWEEGSLSSRQAVSHSQDDSGGGLIPGPVSGHGENGSQTGSI
jgi:hypothetical protein